MTGATLLFRQIHPNFVQDGFASSVAFRPNESDEGLLSVYNCDLITAEASWAHYTTVSKKRSAGTTAVTVDECAAEDLPACPPRPCAFPGTRRGRLHRREREALAYKEQEATGEGTFPRVGLSAIRRGMSPSINLASGLVSCRRMAKQKNAPGPNRAPEFIIASRQAAKTCIICRHRPPPDVGPCHRRGRF
jgi:hypothetical protein